MILQSLVDYYEILTKADMISKPGYCKTKVSYALNLSDNGELVGILPLKINVTQGKKEIEIAQSMEVPEQYKKTVGIKSNFLCENSSYMLGIDNKGKPLRTKECFKAFCELHSGILKNEDTIQAGAILKFIEKWDPDKCQKNPILKDYLDDILTGANLVFYLDGIGFIHECNSIKNAWERYIQNMPDAVTKQCLVTGEKLPIARLHQSIKGVKGAQSTGASIVSFNASAYESYGCDNQQGLNAPVSEKAAFAYTTALNHLLNDAKHKQSFGDSTVVYWAESSNPVYQDIFAYALNPADDETELTDDKASARLIGEIFTKLISGKPISDVSNAFNSKTHFYILGLSPNASRLSIRFYMRDYFGDFIERIMQHYKNMEIEKAPFEPQYVPLWKLMLETVSPMSTDKASSPLLSGAVLRAILTGSEYPAALYYSIIIRIRAEKNVTRAKAAAIKAYLLKKINNHKFMEVLTVSLNEQSNNRAYVLGRLFSVLEKVQLDANPGIKATIKDRYFTSACATPASVFPILLKLSNHHISKSQYGYYSDEKIKDLMDKLNVNDNPFPSHLSLEDQGIFILGYYHQQKANYAKLNKGED